MPINIAKGTEDCQAMSNGLLNLGLEVRVLCQDPAKKKHLQIYKVQVLFQAAVLLDYCPTSSRVPACQKKKEHLLFSYAIVSVYSYRVQSQLCCYACQESSHSSPQLTWPVKLHLKRHQCEMKPCQISTQQKLPGLQACSSMFSTFSCRTKATLLSCCTSEITIRDDPSPENAKGKALHKPEKQYAKLNSS